MGIDVVGTDKVSVCAICVAQKNGISFGELYARLGAVATWRALAVHEQHEAALA